MQKLIIRIKNKIRQLIIDVANIEDASAKENLQREALDLYDDIRDLETLIGIMPDQDPPLDQSPDENTNNEITKVRRRLNLWKTRQEQINSKILNLFISLTEDDGHAQVTEHMLRNAYTNLYHNRQEFFTNYSQMKNISTNNHGKIFDIQGGVVDIWEPVRGAVEEYKNAVFGE